MCYNMTVINTRIARATMATNKNLDDFIHKKIVTCKFCDSTVIVKYGTFEGMQRYFCKDCRRKFADNDALPKMKTPVWIISLALNSFYNGMTLGEIQNEINQRHGAIYAKSSIYNWIVRFSKSAVEQAKSFSPKTGSSWLVVCELRHIGNKKIWFQDVFDIETRLLMASNVSSSNQGIVNIIKKARAKAGKTPDQSVAILLSGNFRINQFRSSLEGIETSQNIAFIRQSKNDDEEHFQEILKRRKNIIRGCKNIRTTQILTDAWQVHYNFTRRNEGTGRTPLSIKTGKIPFKNWTEVVNHS